MSVDPFVAPSHGNLFSTPDMRALWSDARRCAAMIEVEAALARAQGTCGMISQDSAAAISAALTGFVADSAALGAGSESAGVPVPALVAQLRNHVGGEAARYIHWGATSQDIIDTALVLVLRETIADFETALERLVTALATMARAHADTVMLARTRMQQAAPTTFGLKVAGWRAPLVRNRERLDQLKSRLLVAQLGGAAGTLAPLGDRAGDVRVAFAGELGLGLTAMPWHTQRDSLGEFADWLTLTTDALGKIGLDVGMLAQSEMGELRETGEAGRGGSSTLPQKSNPVSSEILVTLARYNANAVGTMHQAALHEGERSGASWSLEWLTLPNMVLALSGALAHADRIANGLMVDTGRMRANIDATNGLCLAEAVSFALSEYMPRAEAQALVTAKCIEVLERGQNLIDLVRADTDVPVDWERVGRPGNWIGGAREFVEEALSH